MKRQPVVFLLLGAFLIITLALIVRSTSSVAASTTSTNRPAAVQAVLAEIASTAQSPSLKLQCNVKVPGGLAQCGSQASSCKNCHEVKGEDPVNAKGDWHVSHAFGDFCEFCHGGNVQATDKTAAHEGLVQPLGDVKTNCSSCHADDYQAKAQIYATALDVTIGSNGPSQPPTGSSNPSEPAAQQPVEQAAPPAAPQPTLAPTPTSSEIVDYVAQYQAEHPEPASAGTIVTSLLLGLTIVGGGSFAYWNEKRLRSKPHSLLSKVAAPVAVADERAQELARLMPTLEKLDVQTLKALRTLLSNRR
jgi:hypothetical protein